MIVCYLDDSGTDDAAPVLTMAGYLGTYTGWALFEQDAKKVFDDFGVKVLHGKEFNDTKGDFRKWSKQKKEKFVTSATLLGPRPSRTFWSRRLG